MHIALAFVAVSGIALFSDKAVAAERSDPISHSFTMSLRSETEMNYAGGEQMKVQASHQTNYTWQSKQQERTLMLDSIFLHTVMNGKEGKHVRMNRREFVNLAGGKTKALAADKAPPELKAMLEAWFEMPLVTLRYDQEGAEIARTFIAKPELVDDTLVANWALFHPIVPTGKSEWSTNSAMMLGTEGLVKGKLEYRKVEEGASPVYAVKGVLTNDRYAAPEGKIVFKDVRYVIDGKQTYAPREQKWLSGQLAAAITYDLEMPNGAKIGSAKGSSAAEMKAREP